jgi:hypothetical protein
LPYLEYQKFTLVCLPNKTRHRLQNRLAETRMTKRFRVRFWTEVAVASLTAVLALITPIFPDWIELISGWDPDQHDGSVESLIVIVLFIVTAAIAGLAVAEWRRTPATA